MAARPVIKEGAKWVVGDGRIIKIWEEKCLPSSESGKIITPRTSLGGDARVASPIVQEQAEWDLSFDKKHLPPNKAEAILSIPISP